VQFQLFIIKQDSKDLFRLQSVRRKDHQPYWDRLAKMDSIILYEPEQPITINQKLKIAKLDSFYSMLVVFKILPTAFRLYIY
jgi:hypothetical protein